jgi:hypothetical protein
MTAEWVVLMPEKTKSNTNNKEETDKAYYERF